MGEIEIGDTIVEWEKKRLRSIRLGEILWSVFVNGNNTINIVLVPDAMRSKKLLIESSR